MADVDSAAVDQIKPTLKLTSQQRELVDSIETFINQHINDNQHAIFVIHGGAGTGKSVVLSRLFYEIQQARANKHNSLYKTDNFFLVNHPELLKTYRQIAGQEPNMYKKNFQRPTSFINKMHQKDAHNDVTIIDEAHLLLSQSDPYNKFMQNNQLSEILKISKVTVVVFDEQQVLRTKCLWTPQRLAKIIKPYTVGEFTLTQQFRMHASQPFIDWLDAFTHGKLLEMPSDFGGYDFRVYDDCDQMYHDILKRDHEYKLSRMLATLSYHAVLGKTSYVMEGNFKLPWDQYNYSHLPYPEIPETLHEVGSMFTCQGFDLNYAGVIIGPSITFDDQTNQILPDVDNYTYPSSMQHRKDVTDPKEFLDIKKKLAMNDLNVLLKRGVKGLYIYVHSPQLRTKLLDMYQKAKSTN